MSQSTTGFEAVQNESIMILHAEDHRCSHRQRLWYIDSLRPYRPITPYVGRQLRQLFADQVVEEGLMDLFQAVCNAEDTADYRPVQTTRADARRRVQSN